MSPLAAVMPQTVAMVIRQILYQVEEFILFTVKGETVGESDGRAGEWEGTSGEVFVLQVSYHFVCSE